VLEAAEHVARADEQSVARLPDLGDRVRARGADLLLGVADHGAHLGDHVGAEGADLLLNTADELPQRRHRIVGWVADSARGAGSTGSWASRRCGECGGGGSRQHQCARGQHPCGQCRPATNW
jgi:hypothetical protein